MSNNEWTLEYKKEPEDAHIDCCNDERFCKPDESDMIICSSCGEHSCIVRCIKCETEYGSECCGAGDFCYE